MEISEEKKIGCAPPSTLLRRTCSERQKIKKSGTYNFQFNLKTQENTQNLTTNLVVEAFEKETTLPIAIKCKWFRVKGPRSYHIEEISGNVYQISAEDISCTIKVEATPIDDDFYKGTALAQYGPVTPEPSQRQSLENILGTGGCRFPVSLRREEKDRDLHPEEEEENEALLIVGSNVLKLDVNGEDGKRQTLLKLKYTIDYPKMEMDPLNTRKFKLHYTDDVLELKGNYEKLDKVVLMKALSRQSRDLIALSIRCFSALTYYNNSKIIENLNKEDL